MKILPSIEGTASGKLALMNWQDYLVENTEEIRALIQATKRIAVLGIKTEAQADQPSVYVPHVSQESRLRNYSGAGLLSRTRR